MDYDIKTVFCPFIYMTFAYICVYLYNSYLLYKCHICFFSCLHVCLDVYKHISLTFSIYSNCMYMIICLLHWSKRRNKWCVMKLSWNFIKNKGRVHLELIYLSWKPLGFTVLHCIPFKLYLNYTWNWEPLLLWEYTLQVLCLSLGQANCMAIIHSKQHGECHHGQFIWEH